MVSISSAILAPQAEGITLTPAMTHALHQIAARLDELGFGGDTDEAKWITIRARRLRGPNTRGDNQWLRTCLDRLMGAKLRGTHPKDGAWRAVFVAQYSLPPHSETARLLIPPAAIQFLKGSEYRFAQIEATALGQLRGHAAVLFALLADRRRQHRQRWWEYDLDELRQLLGVDTPGYQRWYEFRRAVLAPAVAKINAVGLVEVTMKPIRDGRRIAKVRLDWHWRDLTATRARQRQTPDAPPLLAAGRADWWDRVCTWWNVQLGDDERRSYAIDFGRAHPALEDPEKAAVQAWAYQHEHPDDRLPEATPEAIEPPTPAPEPEPEPHRFPTWDHLAHYVNMIWWRSRDSELWAAKLAGLPDSAIPTRADSQLWCYLEAHPEERLPDATDYPSWWPDHAPPALREAQPAAFAAAAEPEPPSDPETAESDQDDPEGVRD